MADTLVESGLEMMHFFVYGVYTLRKKWMDEYINKQNTDNLLSANQLTNKLLELFLWI